MTPDQFEAMQFNREMTQEEFEFYEDFLFLSEVAQVDEVKEIEGEFVITHSGEVKINPKSELKKYLDCRNKQKMVRHQKERRLKSFALLKG